MSDQIRFVKIGSITFVGIEKTEDVEKVQSFSMPQMPQMAPPNITGKMNIIPNASDPASVAAANKANATDPIINRTPRFMPGMENRKLHRPRILIVDHDNNNISLAKCIGNPETLTVGMQMEFSYYNEDPEFEKFFLAETSSIPGLHLIK